MGVRAENDSIATPPPQKKKQVEMYPLVVFHGGFSWWFNGGLMVVSWDLTNKNGDF